MTRESLISKYSGFEKGEFSKDEILTELESTNRILLLQLKSDPFPRFIRSQMMQKAAPSLYKNPDVMILKVVKKFPYTRKDFQIEGFTKKDLDLAKFLFRDFYDWKLVNSKRGVNCYISDMELFPDIPYMKNCSVMKMDIIMPYSFDNCVMVHSSFAHLGMVNKNIEKCESVRSFSAQKVKQETKNDELLDQLLDVDGYVVSTYTNLLYPLNMRKVDQIGGIIKDEDGYFIATKPYELEESQKIAKFTEKGKFDWNGKKKTMYLVPCWGFTSLKKIDENTTLHSELIVTDASGWVTDSVLTQYAYGNVLGKMSDDIYKKYEVVFSKLFSKDKKIEDYREVLMNHVDQGKLVAKIFFSKE